MKKVLILLSTYNGERYLREQLDSLLKQVGVEIHVLVRDDGSKDGTVEILEKYELKNPTVFTIIQSENIGWQRSFLELMKMAYGMPQQYDYYSFCDQDDIWLPEKLERAVERIETLHSNIRLYCSNLYYYKDGQNYGKIKHGDYKCTAANCLVRNYATGCTIVFNRSLLDTIVKNPPQIIVSHDFWAFQVGVLLGEVYIDNEAYILYRQHASNQIGSVHGWRAIWKRRINTLLESYGSHTREREAQELIRCLNKLMTEENKKIVVKAAYYRRNIIARFAFAFDYRYSTGLLSNDFWLHLRIIFGGF